MTIESKKLKITLWDRIRSKWGYLMYKLVGVKYGPFMFKNGPDWWFIDHYGDIYILRYTGVNGDPFMIHREVKQR